MKIIFFLLTFTSVAYGDSIDFSIWISPHEGLGQDVTYIENGVSKKGNSYDLDNCMEQVVDVGLFNKFEATPMRLSLETHFPLTKTPYPFKALAIKGCPKTDKYMVRPVVVVSALTNGDRNNYAAVCSIPYPHKTIRDCIVEIDKIDNTYGRKVSNGGRNPSSDKGLYDKIIESFSPGANKQ